MAYLLEGEIEQAVQVDPRHGDAQDMRRIIIEAARRRASGPADQYGAQLIDAADRGGGVVHGGRDRAQCDVDDLHDAELDVLLHGASRPYLDRRKQLDGALIGDPVAAGEADQRDALGNEMSNAAFQAQTYPVFLCERAQPRDVDKADIAGFTARYHFLEFPREHADGLIGLLRSATRRHQSVDDKLRLAPNAVDDVVDADRVGDVKDEIYEHADANRGEQHRSRHRQDRRERFGQEPGGGKRGDAVGKSAEKHAQRPLRHMIPHEAHEDARGKLRRRQGQCHQEDGEDNRHDGHGRRGDDRQNRLRDLRVRLRGKQRLRNERADGR